MGSTPHKLSGCAPYFGLEVLLECDYGGRSPKLLGEKEGVHSRYVDLKLPSD